MAHIISFVPRDERDSIIQVQTFINHARNSYMGIIGLGKEDFDRSVWTFDMRLLGQKREKNAHIKFTRHEEIVTRGTTPPKEEQLIGGPFLDFCKAIFLHRLVNGNFQATSDLMTVIKALEFVVRNRLSDKAHPSSVTNDDVIKVDNLVAALAKESAYRRGVLLQSLVKILNENRLLARPFTWNNLRSKPRELRMDISSDAEKRRQEKMPSQRAIRVLIQLAVWALEGFLHKKRPIVTLDGVEISKSKRSQSCDEQDAPLVLGLALNAIGLNCRISELAMMPHDPESFTLSKGEIDSDGIAEDEDRFALKWKPVKGGAAMVKPFSRQFAPFAAMIIAKLKELSSEPRKVAKHYEQNPHTLYLPPELEYLRHKEWLTEKDTAKLAGLEVSKVNEWASKNALIRRESFEVGNSGIYQFGSLEKALLKLLPKGFPYIVGKHKYSESMFCCFYSQQYAYRGTCRVIPSNFQQNYFELAISIRPTVRSHQSIFERYGFYEEDGSKIDVGTHDFRHFWQTQLKKAGVSELIAAYAAGRADVKQNEAYDLRSPSEAADLSFEIVDQSKQRVFELSALAIAHEVLESAVTSGSSGKIVVVSFSKDAIVTFDNDSGALNVQGCHLNDYGICKHSYISSGCKKYMECLDCSELLCVKGIKAFEKNAQDKAENLRARLEEYRQQVSKDVEEGIEGADQWLEKTKRQLAKLEMLINDFYMNKQIQNGAIVQLSSALKDSSTLALALIEKLGLVMEKRSSASKPEVEDVENE